VYKELLNIQLSVTAGSVIDTPPNEMCLLNNEEGGWAGYRQYNLKIVGVTFTVNWAFRRN
jgi:hypothetical protein